MKTKEQFSKQILSIFLCVAMMLSYVPVTAFAAEPTVDTAWYNDTDTSFTLTTVAQLAGLADLVNGGTSFSGKTITLGNVIDLSNYDNWTPIGKNSSYSFQGTFDGNGYTISNLKIENDQQYVGLFGYVNSGTIKNVILEAPSVSVTCTSDSTRVGALVGYHSGSGNIEYCAVRNGSVSAPHSTCANTYSGLGGLVGCHDTSGNVIGCYNYMTSVSTKNNTMTRCGGVAGSVNNMATSCYTYNTDQKGTPVVGGYASGSGTPAQCSAYLKADGETSSSITTSTYSAALSAEEFADGTAAYFLRTGGYSNVDNPWGQDVEGDTKDALPVWNGAKVYQMQYTSMVDNTPTRISVYLNDLEVKQIDGVDYRVIYNAYDWALFANQVNLNSGNNYNNRNWNAIVEPAGAVIDFSVFGTIAYVNGYHQKMVMIGANNNSSAYYGGTFNGNGCTVTGLAVNNSSPSYMYGLFGNTSATSHISGITVENATIQTARSNSAVVVVKNCGTLENCHAVNATVSITNGFAGGVTYSNEGTVKYCSFSGSVVSAGNAGGIAGSASSGAQFIKCWNSGTISGKTTSASYGNYAGGILAQEKDGVTIDNCYNTGNITGYYAGGIVGSRYGYGTVKNCHSYGATLTGNKTYPVAYGDGVSNCYYLAESETDTITGTTYKTAAEFKNGTVLALLNGGNTETVWYPYVDYPILEKKEIPHQHNWDYSVNDAEDTITATCDVVGCSNTNGGSVKLVVGNGTYTGSSIGATVEGGFTNGATYKVTYNNGSETAPDAVGTHAAKLTVSENGTEKESLTLEYTISYLPAPNPAYAINGGYKSENTYWFKSGETITVIAPAGYVISKTLNSVYGDSVTFSESENKIVYLKRASDGAMTDAITISENIRFDGNGATGKITIESRGFWEKLLNKITFGLFFKGDVAATVTAMDADSGVNSIQYYVADEDLIDGGGISALESAVGDNWKNYSNEIALNKNAKNVIYIKITDNVGNVTYLNSEGVVIYTDAKAETEIVAGVYKEHEYEKNIYVEFNGNTVNTVANGTTVLTRGEEYTVTEDRIILDKDYLNTLEANTYTFTVSYNPLGETYVEAVGNDAPATTTFTVIVNKADGAVTGISDIGKTYDGTAVSAPTFDQLGDGAATIEYKVKGADDSTYTTTAPKNADDYVVRVTVAESKNYREASATAEFTIGRATLTKVSVKQNAELTYDGGKALTPAVTTNATALNGQKVLFMYSTAENGTYGAMPSFTDAGTHTVYYCAYTTDNNFVDYKDSFTVIIDKTTFTEPTIASKPYNGSVQTADITATDLYTVEKNEGGTVKGSYDVVLKLKDAKNYKWATTDNAEVTLQFMIYAAENTWTTAPAISGWTYGENANAPTYAAKYGTVKVVYTGTANDGSDYNSEDAPTKAGSYTATFTVEGTADYSGLTKQVNFTIAKASYDMTGAKWNYTNAFQYDGKEYKVEVVGLPEGVTVGGYTENTANVVGDYTAKVTFVYDSNNYNAPVVADLNWKIENNWNPTEYTVSNANGNGWHKADVVITAQDGYMVSSTNTADGVWNDILTGCTEGENSITFYVKNTETGAISLAKTVSYKLDKVAPTGKVYFDERNGWESFLNTISFGLFYKEEVTVKADSADALSGVASVEYYASNKAMTLDEVKAITDWTAYNGGVGVTLEDAKQFVYFVRITDNAGNVTYLSTDGAEYDTTAPAISGIENGKTYYTTQKVTITDKNLAAVTLNGEVATESITLEGNKDATYTIIATDKAGNSTTVTVTMKPVVTVGSTIDGITEDNVTSNDKDTVQVVLDEATELLKDNDLTDEEKTALEEIKDIAENLIDKIEAAEKATDTENTEKVEDVTAENVTPENKIDLEKAKGDLEKALEDNGSNYTDAEKKAIEDEIKRIDDALKVIENVEAVENLINKLPETIGKNDEAAIKAADDAYNALSDYEKSLVDKDVKKALDDAKAALAELNKPVADPNSPQTGDNSNLWLWFALLFVSGAGIFEITMYDRKRKAAGKR